jgi:diguanylate cyclase (GGDEF)-like protein
VNVLIAEDEPVSRHRLHAVLTKWGYTVSSTADGAEALRMLQTPDSPRLVLLDRMMPGMDGLEVCRAVRKSGAEPYAYVILLTGRGLHNEVLEGFEAGADDYITKPFEIQDLQARVRTGARIVKLQQELIAAREQLRIQATHDPLTGLLNRGAFFDNLHKDVAWASRHQACLALVMADLDHFKEINDRYGHMAGDAVLRESARRLRGTLRASDSIGRYGGEEFIIAVVDCSPSNAADLAERFRLSVSAQPIQASGTLIPVTLSVGVAVTSDMKHADRLLPAADDALYRAKHGGKNRVEVAAL